MRQRICCVALAFVVIVAALAVASFAVGAVDPVISPVANSDSYTASANAPITPLTVAAPGVLANDSGAGLTAILVTNVSSGMLTLNMSGGFTYTPNTAFFGTDSFTYKAHDSHGDSAPATVSIAVSYTNLPPVIAKPGAQTVQQGVALAFTGANTVSVSDPDAGASPIIVTLGVAAGNTLSVTATGGVTITGNGTNNISLTGPQAGINTALAGLTYTSAAMYTGMDTLAITANDQGNTGAGGAQVAMASVAITVTHPNQPPVNTVPMGPLLVNPAVGYVFSSANMNAISVSDPDAGTSAISVTVSVPMTNGTFSIPGMPMGVTITGGGTNSINISGPQASINTALNSLTYTAGAFTGMTTLTVLSNDNGNIGTGGAKTDTDTVTLNVAPPPTITGTTPANGATAVPVNSTITVTFDKSVNATTASFKLECPTGTAKTFSLSASPATTFTLTPTANLPATTICTVTVLAAQITDLAGTHPTMDTTFSFTTDTIPAVTATTPANGATAVAPNATITLTFNKSVSATIASFKLECPTGTTKTFTLSASPASTFTLTPTANLPAGTVCTVTALAAQISDGAGVKPAMNYVFSFTVAAAPTPMNDTFTGANSAIGNTLFAVGQTPSGPAVKLTGNVLSNDTDPQGSALTIATYQMTSANGGTVNLNTADGTFTYLPAAGYNGTDTFTYTVQNTYGLTASGTVSINVANRVWYINNAAGSAGDGRSTTPFNSLSGFNGATTFSNDFVFVYVGNSTTTAYSGGVTLKDGQKLYGEAFGLTVAGNGLVLAGMTQPRINNTGGNAVSVPATSGNRQNVEVRGLDLQAGPSGNGVDVTASGANIVSVTITNINVRGAGGSGIVLSAGSTGAFTATVTNNTIAATNDGINATAAAATALTLDVSNNTVSSAGATGITVAGSGATTTITGFASNSISGSVTGTGITIDTAKFDATPGGAYQQVSGGSTTVGVSGNGVGVAGILLSNVSGDLAFTDLNIYADSGTGLGISGTGAVNTGAGTGTRVTVGAGVGTVEAVNGPAVKVVNATIDLQFTTVKSTTSAANGVSLDTVGGIFAAGSGSSITNATGADFNVNAGNATVTYGGTISDSTGRLVSVTNTTGGTKTFSGAISDSGGGSGTGISLTNNTGATIAFSGAISLTTGANAAFTATGGGTVTATDTTSTLTTTTATALNVANTTIGAAGLKFKSISAGTGASGPASGIILNTTGASGGLSVLGTGTTQGSGGTIQKTTGDGVSLTSTLSPSFNGLVIQNSAASGVKGAGVTNFAFTNGTIDTSGQVSLDVTDSNIAFNDTAAGTNTNITGTVTITGNTLLNAYGNGVSLFNYNGTLDAVTISNNTITSSTSVTTSKGSAIQLVAFGSATTAANVTKATIASNTISNFPGGAGIALQGGNADTGGPRGTFGIPNDATNIISVTGNTIQGQSAANRLNANAILYTVQAGNIGARGRGNVDISNNGTVANPITNISGSVFDIASTGYADVTVKVDNNVIVANHTPDFGGPTGISAGTSYVGAATNTTQDPTLSIAITNNRVSKTDGNGILLTASSVTATVTAKINNNTIGMPVATMGLKYGIRVSSGSSTGNNTLNLEITGNTSASTAGEPGIGLRKQGTVATVNVFGIEGLSANPTSAAATAAYVSSQNPGSAFDSGMTTRVRIISGDNFVPATVP